MTTSKGVCDMPVLLVPILIGIPVVLGGGYLLYRVFV
jgi:hypothetical protein